MGSTHQRLGAKEKEAGSAGLVGWCWAPWAVRASASRERVGLASGPKGCRLGSRVRRVRLARFKVLGWFGEGGLSPS